MALTLSVMQKSVNIEAEFVIPTRTQHLILGRDIMGAPNVYFIHGDSVGNIVLSSKACVACAVSPLRDTERPRMWITSLGRCVLLVDLNQWCRYFD